MDRYLEGAYLPALERYGIGHVGVFKPRHMNPVTGNFIVVLIPFESLEQFRELDAFLAADHKYRADAKDFLESLHDQPPYQRMESNLLKSFPLMPEYHVPDHPTPGRERVYELRSYESATEQLHKLKVQMFNEGGEMAIFERLGFQPVFYGSVITGAHMPNLMYMTTFENEHSNIEHWDAFRSDSAWIRLQELEKYANTVSEVDRWLLYPVEYSGI